MATAETAITIVAASIPVLRALIKDKRALISAAPRFYRYYVSRDGSDPSEGSASTTTGKVPPSPYSAVLKSPINAVTRKSRQYFFDDNKQSSTGSTGENGTWTRDQKRPVQDASWLSSASAVEMVAREEWSRGGEGKEIKRDGAGVRKGSLG